jgi:hypothetical protein
MFSVEKTNGVGDGNITLDNKTDYTETQVIFQPNLLEFNKSNITEQGAEELDKLVEAMNTKRWLCLPHTDNRGSDRYNLTYRKKSKINRSVHYLKSITRDRITGQDLEERN